MTKLSRIYGIQLSRIAQIFRIRKARLSRMFGVQIPSPSSAWTPEMLMPDGALFPTAWTVVGAADRVLATAKNISTPDDTSYVYNNHSNPASDPIWFKLQDFSIPADGTYQANIRVRGRRWNNGTDVGIMLMDSGMGIGIRNLNFAPAELTTSFATYESGYGFDVVLTAANLIDMRVVIQSYSFGVGDAVAFSAINIWVKRVA